MRKLSNVLVLIAFLSTQHFMWTQAHAKKENQISIGLSYGIGTQQVIPFDSKDYEYDYQSYRLLFNYRFKKFNRWKLELTVEPSLYLAEHQLLNIFYVQPRHGTDYLEQRGEFSQEKQIREYALNLGVLIRYQFINNLSFFAQGAVGPMFSDVRTERLAKGFAFSDVLALGCSYEISSVRLDVKTGIRHVSNFNFQLPNSGHNSVLLEMGFSFGI